MPWGWIFAQIIRDGRSTKVAKMMVVRCHLIFLWRGQVCFFTHLYGPHTFVCEKCWEFQTTSPLKPLCQCCSNFMWSLLRLGEWKMAKIVMFYWPRWLPCLYMVKTFKNLLLQNQISPGALSLHESSGIGDVPKLLKWWSYVHIWPFYGKVKFASHVFVWALYIYMGKMLRIHILDISSIIQLNRNLMMSIRALMRQKLAKWADRKSKMATTAAILKINFRHLFSNLRSLWAETCSLAAGLGGSVGCTVRLETRRSRVQSPPRSATFFRGDWSWNSFYGHSLPSADSRRAVVSFWRKNVHNTG